jgi:hypothetical protein
LSSAALLAQLLPGSAAPGSRATAGAGLLPLPADLWGAPSWLEALDAAAPPAR